MLRFAVISDSHIRLPTGASEGGYPSNARTVERSTRIVEAVNELGPEFVIHLGDVVHPIPALDSHEEAVLLAREVFGQLDAPLYLLPGNHDIGDKHNAWMPAPVVEEDSHVVFTRHWGPLYQSFDAGECHFVMLDTPVLNSGLAREDEQRDWLERDLAANARTGRRLFVLTHYPLFLFKADEPKHYDNIEEPARSWLLGLLKRYGAEAVFSGHVHNFFFNHLDGVRHYILPSTAFVRPEYAEFAHVGPASEFGRDDGAKLGFFLVEVDEQDHRVTPIRSDSDATVLTGAASRHVSRLGVRLRHNWAEPIQLPAEGLDEFTRKQARNDYVVQAFWELGTVRVRVPLADLRSATGRARMADLSATGQRFTVFDIGLPTPESRALVTANAALLDGWEIIVPPESLRAAARRLSELRDGLNVPVFLSPVQPMRPSPDDGKTFEHFASHGFAAEEVSSFAPFGATVNGLVFRSSPFEDPWDGVAAIVQATSGLDVLVSVNLQLPRLDEGVAFLDDDALTTHVLRAALAAWANPGLRIFLDTFIDHDRGYYPRAGLLDRRFNPRPAFNALRRLEGMLSGLAAPLVIEPSRSDFHVTGADGESRLLDLSTV
jgi:3',5'-cyclic AMP phosphodiesterase CpdA